MKLIYFPLGVMVLVCLINLFLGGVFQDVTSKAYDTTVTMHLDLTTIQVTILTGAIITVALLGVEVCGSGLGDSAHHTIILIVFYVGIWVMLTTMAWGVIWSIPSLGLVFYFLLLIVFIIGVIQEIGSGS